jgi:hypothetical protein
MTSTRVDQRILRVSRGNARVPRVLVLTGTTPKMDSVPYLKISHYIS